MAKTYLLGQVAFRLDISFDDASVALTSTYLANVGVWFTCKHRTGLRKGRTATATTGLLAIEKKGGRRACLCRLPRDCLQRGLYQTGTKQAAAR